MKLEYINKHKKTSRARSLLIVVVIVASLAVLTFLGSFLDYYFGTNVITYVAFAVAFIMAYMVFKKTIVEYKYIYAEDVFTVDRLIDGGEKVIFACDKSYIEDVLPYSECKAKYEGIKFSHLSFEKKEKCTAVVYTNEDRKKAVLIYADEQFASKLKEII